MDAIWVASWLFGVVMLCWQGDLFTCSRKVNSRKSHPPSKTRLLTGLMEPSITWPRRFHRPLAVLFLPQPLRCEH
jgi:hypothetical protein